MTKNNSEYQALDSIIKHIAKQKIGKALRDRLGDVGEDVSDSMGGVVPGFVSDRTVEAYLALPGAKASIVTSIADQLEQIFWINDEGWGENEELTEVEAGVAVCMYKEEAADREGGFLLEHVDGGWIAADYKGISGSTKLWSGRKHEWATLEEATEWLRDRGWMQPSTITQDTMKILHSKFGGGDTRHIIRSFLVNTLDQE